MAQVAASFDTTHNGPIHDAQLDYYGKLLASSSADHSVRLWDVSSEAPRFLSELRGHDGPVWQVSWSHPKFGSLLASGSFDRKVIIWKEHAASNSWIQAYAFEEHTSSVNAVEFSPWEFGLNLACGSSDGTVSIHTYNPDQCSWTRKIFAAHPSGVLSLSWCPYAAMESAGGNVAASGGMLTAPAPGAKRLVTGGCDHQVRVWNFADVTNEWIEAGPMEGAGHTSWVRDVAWRPYPVAGNVIASCSDDQTLILWQETESNVWRSKQVIQLNEPAWRVSWSVTGAVLAVSSGVDNVTIYKENIRGGFEPLTTGRKDTTTD